MPAPTKPTKPGKSKKTVGFRPEQDVYDILAKRAASLGLSINELACHYVTGIVRGTPAEKTTADPMAALVAELREDIAVGIETLLAHAGKVPEPDAKRWADENLRN